MSSKSLLGKFRVSVMMPVFNTAPKYIDRAIDSILKQTFLDFEFVIFDDGSTNPETISCLDMCSDKDPRIRLFRENHAGITPALNKGLSYCQGELVCRQDADDWSEPDRIEKQVAFFEKYSEVVLVGTNAMMHQEDGSMLWATDLPCESDSVKGAFPCMNPFVHGSVCFRRKAAEAVGGYRLDFSEDYDLFWRLCERSNGANLPEPLYHLRRVAGSVSEIKAYEQALGAEVTRCLACQRQKGEKEDLFAAAKYAGEGIPEADHVKWILKQADQMMLAGHYKRAVSIYMRAIMRKPFYKEGLLKLVRFGLFVTVPILRKTLFSLNKLS